MLKTDGHGPLHDLASREGKIGRCRFAACVLLLSSLFVVSPIIPVDLRSDVPILSQVLPQVEPIKANATCAQGGACVVGDTGPGGGKVFYVSATNFTSTGSDCGTACKYLEAAPVQQSTGIVWATTTANCYALDSTTGNQSCQQNSIYSGTGQAAKFTASEAIGMGMSNTAAIVARHDAATPSVSKTLYAAGIADSYSVNGKTDWHLPSRLELNQLCRYAGNQTVDNAATTCGVAVGAVKAGFETGRLWNSSESALNGASNTNFFADGIRIYGFWASIQKSNTIHVRAVRAFAPTG